MVGAPTVLAVAVNTLKKFGVVPITAPSHTVTAVGDKVLADDCVWRLLRGTSFFSVALTWAVHGHLFLTERM